MDSDPGGFEIRASAGMEKGIFSIASTITCILRLTCCVWKYDRSAAPVVRPSKDARACARKARTADQRRLGVSTAVIKWSQRQSQSSRERTSLKAVETSDQPYSYFHHHSIILNSHSHVHHHSQLSCSSSLSSSTHVM
jgi:hypothetical protein